eukprot:gnl/TRDRNA2_/TRDRNA2_134889_c0_seq1.p1 gnl/TRDRNA2_/TRDRNA2_134889_c0~~gnl/TRDRNA2_/TRDRNA2_134889_c0_seq1.p1  ORF type:complete len:493 (+),score=63.63 gnl/TRDRNA2_/TRDRNA2_134889_c0_seq1:80-1558(+)
MDPEEASEILDDAQAALAGWKEGYHATRVAIEETGFAHRWEFKSGIVLGATGYASRVCSQLGEALAALSSLRMFLASVAVKSSTGSNGCSSSDDRLIAQDLDQLVSDLQNFEAPYLRERGELWEVFLTAFWDRFGQLESRAASLLDKCSAGVRYADFAFKRALVRNFSEAGTGPLEHPVPACSLERRLAALDALIPAQKSAAGTGSSIRPCCSTDNSMAVRVVAISGFEFVLRLLPEATVTDAKRALESLTGIPTSQQRLTLGDRLLVDDDVLLVSELAGTQLSLTCVQPLIDHGVPWGLIRQHADSPQDVNILLQWNLDVGHGPTLLFRGHPEALFGACLFTLGYEGWIFDGQIIEDWQVAEQNAWEYYEDSMRLREGPALERCLGQAAREGIAGGTAMSILDRPHPFLEPEEMQDVRKTVFPLLASLDRIISATALSIPTEPFTTRSCPEEICLDGIVFDFVGGSDPGVTPLVFADMQWRRRLIMALRLA